MKGFALFGLLVLTFVIGTGTLLLMDYYRWSAGLLLIGFGEFYHWMLKKRNSFDNTKTN